MSEENDALGDSSEKSSPAEIKSKIEQDPAEPSDIADHLSDTPNVKSQVGHRVESVKETVSARAAQAKAAAPPQIQHALDKVGEKAGPVAHQINAKTEPHRSKIVAGAVAALAVLLLLRRRRRRDDE